MRCDKSADSDSEGIRRTPQLEARASVDRFDVSCAGRCLGHREEEDAPTPWCALDPDAPAVRLNDSASDRQSQSGPVASALLRLPETVEDVRKPLGGDAAAGIGDPEQDLALPRRGADRDTALDGREFDPVTD